MKKTIIYATSALVLSACGGGIFDESCDSQRDDLVKKRGAPDKIDKFDSDDYHSWSYWYWKSGFERTFTWGGAAGSCSTSDYSFTPTR